MTTAVEAPATDALAAAMQGFSIEQLTEFRRSSEAEIQRLQAAIPLQPEAARAAFERKDADSVRTAFEAEADLTRRLAAEQSRLSLIVGQLNELVLAEVHTSQAAIQGKLDGVNSEADQLLTSLVGSIAAVEAAMTALEQRGPWLSRNATEPAEQAVERLSVRCGGGVPGAGMLAPRQVPSQQLSGLPCGDCNSCSSEPRTLPNARSLVAGN
jgi:hypothetical protein